MADLADLTLVCVTKAEPCIRRLLVRLAHDAYLLNAECLIAADGKEAQEAINNIAWATRPPTIIEVNSRGYIESVLDCLADLVPTEYAFRIDDDESLSSPLLDWLADGLYLQGDGSDWKFPRVHLWNDDRHFISSPPLWPDHQTRLGISAHLGGRQHIHAGARWGGGQLCDYPIIHHKFIVKTLEQRLEVAKNYERIQPGAGSGHFLAFSAPELWGAFNVEEISLCQ